MVRPGVAVLCHRYLWIASAVEKPRVLASVESRSKRRRHPVHYAAAVGFLVDCQVVMVQDCQLAVEQMHKTGNEWVQQ